MKTKTMLLLGLTLIFMLAVATVAATASGDGAVPFHAVFTTYPETSDSDVPGVGIVSIPGVGYGTHLGNSNLDADLRVDRRGYPWTQSCDSMTLTAANGDELFMTCSGQGGVLEEPEMGDVGVWFAGEYTITDGSGRFDEVQGSGLYSGQAFNFIESDTWIGRITFEGVLQK